MEKGAKRAHNRKIKTNDEAKAKMEQLFKKFEEKQQEINGIISGIVSKMADTSLINETISEQTIQQTVKEKRDKISSDLRNTERYYETRLAKQQEACRLEKQWKKEDQDKNDKANPNSLDNIIERYVIQKRADIQTKTISEKVKDAWINIVNYTKIGQKTDEKKQVTSKLINQTLVDHGDLCMIDFDIKKNLAKEKIDEIRQNIIDNMLPANVGLVKTCYGELHAYCNKNGYRFFNNRCAKCIVLDNIKIDIFAQTYKHKSFDDDPIIREKKSNIIEALKYEAINEWASMSHLGNLRDILEKWNVDIEIPYAEFEKLKITRVFGQSITNDGIIDKMDDELAQACVDGLKNLTIYNYSQPIVMEVPLLSVFCEIYGKANQQIRAQGLENIRKFNTLTPNAEKNYGQALGQGECKPNVWILTKILKYHNKEYYEQTIKPLLKKNYEATKLEKQIHINQTLIPNMIYLFDDFTLLHIQMKASSGEYKNEEKIVIDLTRIVAYYASETEDIYMIKEFDAICGTLVIHHKLEGTIYKQLEKIYINFKKKKSDEKNDETKESTPAKQLTAKHIFKKYASKFVMKRCKFISDDPEIFNIFQGYKYKKLDTFDQGFLQMYLDLIRETIAAGDERIQEYILNWMAWFLQNPGKKSRAAIILQDRQGIDKNRFTDVIAELINRFSCPNITNIEEFTGDFNSVVENKMFAVLNEMKNYNDFKKGIATVMKSIISDQSIRIIEKNQPRSSAENVMKIIYVSNADSTVQFDTDDRCHLLSACKQFIKQLKSIKKMQNILMNQLNVLHKSSMRIR
ncbi:MAG: hypothetical protein EZS28_026596 [Streblomastix strix]|uniref:NrS-1 polymerase-like helicase domain-containing protein n=1 Tax=Streblomastix strix TaxID=222440 RepID=A0A5J4V5L3_9EUKA|nr:MAG: hypothetical protein EZS28_026596 [Streblomastix strix]